MTLSVFSQESNGDLTPSTSGFNVYYGKTIWPQNEDGLENLASYIIRASFSQERMTYIAVLPFTNMIDDHRKEFLSDGITEQIITSLSKIPRLFVISRTSTFSYKNKPVKVQQVAEELGIRYVLEGSVQQSGDKIRITAQLIDALTGRHMWAQRYERNYEDIFALQDEITLKILKEIGVKLTEGETIHSLTKKITNLDAFEKWLEGITRVRAFNIESNAHGPTAGRRGDCVRS